MGKSVDTLILENLLFNEQYVRKILVHLDSEYFRSSSNRLLFGLMKDHFVKYNSLPTKETLFVELEKLNISQTDFEDSKTTVDILEPNQIDLEWLTDQTESFCQNAAIYNALTKSIEIVHENGENPHGLEKGAIPKLLQDALAVSFDTHVGHDYFEDADRRFEFYHSEVQRLPFNLDILNKITGGGLPMKSLSCLLASTGIGKTLIMTALAADHLKNGKNVLFITLEMPEEEISRRIDANLLDIPIQEVEMMGKEAWDFGINSLRRKTQGNLVVKEFAPGSAGANHFRFLLNDLKLKKNFIPDIIYIDYMGLCISSRMKLSPSVPHHLYIKAISEELRAIAVEMALPIVTAVQGNRNSVLNTELELSDIADSYSSSNGLDLLLAVMQPEELAELGQYLFKQLKNRYNNINYYNKFIVGVSKTKMQLYDIIQDAMVNNTPVVDDTPVFDKGALENSNKKDMFKGFN